jgi:hypothetical protein
VKNGVCGLQFDRADIKMNKFVAACLESQLHVYDARTQHPREASAGDARSGSLVGARGGGLGCVVAAHRQTSCAEQWVAAV